MRPRSWSPPVERHLTAARQVVAQDVVPAETGATVRTGVAADRRTSLADAEMRHGRQSKAVRFDGHKRQVVRDLGQAGSLRAVGVTPAGRAKFRERVGVEQSLARLSQVQGDVARYRGLRQ